MQSIAGIAIWVRDLLYSITCRSLINWSKLGWCSPSLFQTLCLISISHYAQKLIIYPTSPCGSCVSRRVLAAGFCVQLCAAVWGFPLVQICYVSLLDIMGTSLHWYRVVLLLTAVIPVCLLSPHHVHQASTSHNTGTQISNKRLVNVRGGKLHLITPEKGSYNRTNSVVFLF